MINEDELDHYLIKSKLSHIGFSYLNERELYNYLRRIESKLISIDFIDNMEVIIRNETIDYILDDFINEVKTPPKFYVINISNLLNHGGNRYDNYIRGIDKIRNYTLNNDNIRVIMISPINREMSNNTHLLPVSNYTMINSDFVCSYKGRNEIRIIRNRWQ